MKSKIFEELDKILKVTKPPQVSVVPKKMTAKERKNAEILEAFINYCYDNNVNGITTKYMKLEKLYNDTFLPSVLWGLKVDWYSAHLEADKIINEEKKIND